jgi:hypothetical protein
MEGAMLGFFRKIKKESDDVATAIDPAMHDILHQLQIVEQMEREISKLPPEVQNAISGELRMARASLNQGQKVPAATISHLVQAQNNQDMRNALKGIVGGCALCCTDVSAASLCTAEMGGGLGGAMGMMARRPRALAC